MTADEMADATDDEIIATLDAAVEEDKAKEDDLESMGVIIELVWKRREWFTTEFGTVEGTKFCNAYHNSRGFVDGIIDSRDVEKSYRPLRDFLRQLDEPNRGTPGSLIGLAMGLSMCRGLHEEARKSLQLAIDVHARQY